MEIDRTCAPRCFTLKLINDLPIWIIKTFGQSDQNGGFLQFLTQVTDLMHYFTAIACAADKDDGSVTPIILSLNEKLLS